MVLNLNQDSKNIVSTKCLNVTFTEGDAINLQKTYPMKDEDGAKLTPYTFTLKNDVMIKLIIKSIRNTYRLNIRY